VVFKLLKILGIAWLNFRKDHCLVRASGLAFTSFIALVPFITLTLSFLSLFGVFEPLIGSAQQFIVTILLPTKQQATLDFISQFLENAKTVGYVGLFSFIFVAVFLINNIVTNVNAVWGTNYTGRFVSRLSVYITIPLFTALILGVTVSLIGWIQPLLSQIMVDDVEILSGFAASVLPELIVLLTLFLLFFLIPYTRVNAKSALLGAVMGVVFWEISKFIFVFAINSVISFSVIYGSIAVLLIFMIWLYIAWGVFLFAFEVTYVHQYGTYDWAGKISLEMPPKERLLLGLKVFFHIVGANEENRKPPDTGAVLLRFPADGFGVTHFLQVLKQNGFVRQVGGKHSGYIPTRSLSEISARDLLRVLLGYPENFDGRAPADGLNAIINTFSAGGLETLADTSVLDIMETIKTD
jgi:membrane protein